MRDAVKTSSIGYVQRKLVHMLRTGIPASLGPHGGAQPDWARDVADRSRKPASEPRRPSKRPSSEWEAMGAWGQASIKAVRLHAKANPTDPWAGPRMRLHIEQGLEDDPEAVSKVAEAAIAAREKAIDNNLRRQLEAQK